MSAIASSSTSSDLSSAVAVRFFNSSPALYSRNRYKLYIIGNWHWHNLFSPVGRGSCRKQEKSFATDISGVLFAGERLLTFLAGLETFLNAKTKGLDRKNLDLR